MSQRPLRNFALVGAAGYIAPRHLQAIRDTGNRLVAAADPHDAVGILDSFFPEARYFKEIERFDRHLEKLHRASADERIQWVSICSPNYLHDAHIRMALRSGADALCEKPLVLSPWNLDALEEIERETDRRVFTLLQLRVHPALVALRESIRGEAPAPRRQVVLTYVTARGPWYRYSWKGDELKSGGVATNIGVHFFDLLIWLFGAPEKLAVHVAEPDRMAGFIALPGADVRWFLSIAPRDLPFPLQPGIKSTYRSITVDGREIEFTDGFKDLHTRVYEETLAGSGFPIAAARPSIELVYRIRTTPVTTPEPGTEHPEVRLAAKGV